MYRIDETKDKERYLMLIPAMLDAHFPLLRFAFYSKDYHPIILKNEEGIDQVGLRYVNNDMCYPAIRNVGQMIAALQSGLYDLSRTVLLMPQAGDACRGSNYVSVLRRAVKKAGFQVPVLSLNVKGMEKEEQVRLRPDMVWRALISVIYGDLLMILANQTKPYEQVAGTTEIKRQYWFELLGSDLKSGKHLGLGALRKRMGEIVADFKKITLEERTCQKVGLVGELYVKYCHLGNWNMLDFLAKENCECYVNGMLWYVLYYIDTHLIEEKGWMRQAYKIVFSVISKLQRQMIQCIRAGNFYVMDEYAQFKKQAQEYVCFHNNVGDGWLIGAEVVNHDAGGYHKVIAAQPFGCMPNQICGRGIYPSLSRRLKNLVITSVDIDQGASSLNIQNRVKMALDWQGQSVCKDKAIQKYENGNVRREEKRCQ